MAATLGAGVQDGELFAAMAEHNALAVGGENNDVGVVGWATGGGHGLATGVYGMGADNIIEAVIVTPSGEVLTANDCQNEDPFWAVRGGGVDVSPLNNTSTKDWYNVVAQMHREFPRLQDLGVHGYYTLSSSPMPFNVAFLQYNAGNKTSSTLLAPIQIILRAASGTASSHFTEQWSSSWYDLVKDIPHYSSTGKMHSTRASQFLPRRAMNNKQLLARSLEAIMAPDSLSGRGVSNPSVSGTMTASQSPVNNAFNPAWRDSRVHIITTQIWDDTLSHDLKEKAIHGNMFKRGYALRQLAPDTVLILMKQTRTSQTGSGLSGDPTTHVFTQSSRNMIPRAFSGVTIVWPQAHSPAHRGTLSMQNGARRSLDGTTTLGTSVSGSGVRTVKLRTRIMEEKMEDPATVSAACALSSYLALREYNETTIRFEVTQGVEMGRLSDIHVELSVEVREDGERRVKEL
ncbi:hypothetical protein BJX99DRAFT_254158 [Aspergillus californicus]